MTPQEIFETVAKHLFKQGERSMWGGSGEGVPYCAYRGSGGKKCAVGAILPDDHYKPSMEALGILSLVTIFPNLPEFIRMNANLLGKLQAVHDTPGNWRGSATMRAKLRDAVGWDAVERTALFDITDVSFLETLSFEDGR